MSCVFLVTKRVREVWRPGAQLATLEARSRHLTRAQRQPKGLHPAEARIHPSLLNARVGSSQHFEPVLLDHGQPLARHATGPPGSGLPLLHRGLAGVEIAGEYGLTDMCARADLDSRSQ